MNGNMNIVFVLAFILFSLHGTYAKWVKGTLDSNSNWEFLTRFCFLTKKGALKYEYKYPVGYGTQEILLYYDTPGQWDAIYKTGKSCEEKMSVLSINSNQIIALNTSSTQTSAINKCIPFIIVDVEKIPVLSINSNQIIALNTSNTQTSAFSGCELINQQGDTWYHCRGQRSFRSSRERWWYIGVARCGPPKDQVTGLYLEYEIHMTNGDDLLHKEFSADEFYILPVDIAFFIIYIFMCLLSVICAVVLRNKQLFHTTYKLYLAALFVWTFHLLLMVIAWGYYGTTGWEISSVEVTGRILQAASTIIFILMLILMAKGYTITRGRLTKSSTIKITVFLNVYIVVIVVLFIWEGMFFDPGKVLYYYESPPGYGLIAMHLIGWLWFLYATVFTLKHTTTKTIFYIPFFGFYTLWFWAGPVVTLVAMFVMAKWSREKTVNGVEQLVGFSGHVFFLILTRPSAANSNFPYHVRTSQIASLPSDDDEIIRESNPYVISSDVGFTGSGPNLDFFITSKMDDQSPSSNGFINNTNNNINNNMNNNNNGHDQTFGHLNPEAARSTSPPPSYPQALQYALSADSRRLGQGASASSGSISNSNMSSSNNNNSSNIYAGPSADVPRASQANHMFSESILLMKRLGNNSIGRGSSDSSSNIITNNSNNSYYDSSIDPFAVNCHTSPSRERIIPPIRGSGLPPLFPTAPLEELPSIPEVVPPIPQAVPRSAPPPSYLDTFEVHKS